METIVAIVGSLLAAGGTIPYIIETVKGKTKPRIVSWFTWALLTGIASAAAFADGQVSSGLFAAIGAVATGSVVLAGVRYGDRSFGMVDIACLIGVVLGIGLWQLFDSPAIGVWAAIIIDFIGLVPTLKHAWQKPHEETLSTFILVAAGGAIATVAIFASGRISVTAIGYSLYVAVSMGSVATVIAWRNRLVTPAATSDVVA